MATDAIQNVLFISADQWRGECLSALGHPVVKTPNLDRLAADGVLFTRHFGQAAPCGPARASLLTGTYAMNHRSVRNGTPLDRRHTNIALEARGAGHDPILFGYTDTSPDPRDRAPADPALADYGGVLPGFREGLRYEHEICLAWLGWLRRHGYPVAGNDLGAYLPAPGSAVPEGRGHSFLPPVYRAEHSDTAYTAERVLDYLDTHRDRSWFVHAVFMRPHPPLYAPEPYNALYRPEEVPEPRRRHRLADERAQHPFLDFWLQQQGQPGFYWGHPCNVRDLPGHEIRQLRATYYGLITEVDHHLGRLIEHLRSTGEYDRTLIVFTVDHGEQLGDHWLWGKGGYFDASYHIPLIIRDPRPGAVQGGRVEAFTEAVDLMPTILEWIGQRLPASCDGHSLLPFLAGRTPARWRDAVHWEYDFRDPLNQHAEQALGLDSNACTLNVIRTGRHKYVHFTDLPPLLFDLAEDPDELHDRAADPACRDAVLDCASRLLSLRMRHAERTLVNTLLTPRGPITWTAGAAAARKTAPRR